MQVFCAVNLHVIYEQTTLAVKELAKAVLRFIIKKIY